MRAVISSETDRVYEFGEFRLDPAAKILFCRDEPVALTPKVFDTLQFMVENAGRLLGKDELMERLWQDRFVEEGNLTFNIKVLRRALHDDAQHPRFIETVPRRGYRFIAEVKQRSLPLTESEPSLPVSPAPRRKLYWAIAVGSVVVAGAVTLGVWLWQQRHAAAETRAAPVLAAPFKSQKLSNTPSGHALITPDGKYVAYTSESAGKQSIWLRQLETSENIQIVPPAEVRYLGLAISHDGNSLYFVRRDSADESASSMYRVMTFGGIPVKITTQPEGWIAVSPDDKQISFVRCDHQPTDNCSLFVIGSDGRNERRIVTRQRPARITANKFSPDGKSIVFAAGQSFNGSRDFHLFRVNLADGVESEVSRAAFFVVSHLEALPGDEAYLFSAEETLDGKSRIWEVRRNGDIKALTDDSTDYDDISLSKSGDRMAATHLSNNFQLHLAAVADAGNPKVLISARTVTFAPDDQLVYSDDGDLWTINHDGANQRQLTSNAFNDFSPRVSPDGRYIFFASNRAGSNQVWRMNADGSDQIQLTHSEGGYPMMVTPDGNYVYFLSGLHQTLWQVAVDGGKETQLWDQSVYAPAFSPDGKLVAYVRDPHRAAKLEIINLADHRSLQNFALNGGAAEISKMVWANSAKSLIYINANGPRKSLWEQPLDGAAPRMIAELGNDEIEDLAVSTDGHTLSFIRGKWIHTVVLIEGLKVN